MAPSPAERKSNMLATLPLWAPATAALPLQESLEAAAVSLPVQSASPPLTPKTPTRHRLSRSQTDPSAPSNHRRSSSLSTLDLVFSPRPFEPLFAERAYLTTSLELLSSKRAALIAHYSATQDQLDHSEPSPRQRRRLRKRLSLLRCKIGGAAEQQKTLFVRLGEVFVELESREAWSVAQHQHPGSFSPADTPASPGPESPSHASLSLSTPSTPLKATSPDFIPRTEAMNPITPASGRGAEADEGQGSPASALLETVDEAGEDFSGHGLGYEYQLADGDAKLRPGRRLSLDGHAMLLAEKRLSVPNLQTAWPEL